MPSVPIIMPQLGESIAEANIISFLVKPGDAVEADQDLIEVETNKATMTVTSPCRGRVEKVTAQLGESYAVGDTLGQIEATKEELVRLGLDVPAPAKSDDDRPAATDGGAGKYRVQPTVRGLPVPANASRRELSFAAAQGAHPRTRLERRRPRGRGRQRRGGPRDSRGF